jgi:hypothetical protein
MCEPSGLHNLRLADGSINRVAVKPPDRRQQFGGTVEADQEIPLSVLQLRSTEAQLSANAQPSVPRSHAGLRRWERRESAGACQKAFDFILPQTGVYARKGDQWIFLPKSTGNSRRTISALPTTHEVELPNGIQTQLWSILPSRIAARTGTVDSEPPPHVDSFYDDVERIPFQYGATSSTNLQRSRLCRAQHGRAAGEPGGPVST